MHRWKHYIYNTSFVLNCLLVFLLIFENRFITPQWLQVVGRMHPLLLHFPIVLMVVTIFVEVALVVKKNSNTHYTYLSEWLLLITAITAAASALMGLLLSKEEGYSSDTIAWHKWSGIFISLLAFGWYGLRHYFKKSSIITTVAGIIGMAAVIVTGHLGATITHGENFLLAPVIKEKETANVLMEEAIVFTHMVQPILDAKCNSCHNGKKSKGELIMETTAGLLKGGKNGLLWDSTQKDYGLLMSRLHLPLQDKKHMPPTGKPQLTAIEESILNHWIRSGASFTSKVNELPETDTLNILAATLFNTIETDNYSFKPAEKSIIESLNNNYRQVASLATGSPALGVDFFGASQFKSEHLKELLQIKEQVVALNLNKMPVTDEDLKTISEFTHLRRLNLAFTNISGNTLTDLISLKDLKQLSLSGTKVKPSQLIPLAALPQLTRLFIWNTPVQTEQLATLQKQFRFTKIETGFTGDAIVIKLNKPQIENEYQIIGQPVPLVLKHYIKGVTMRYTTDGSEPDSVTSPVYKAGFMIDQHMTIKVKAYKNGWLSSDVAEREFYKAGIKVDSVSLLYPPEPKYRQAGARTLIDAKNGDPKFRFDKWLGYQNQPLVATLYFKEPPVISSVNISHLINIYNSIFPARQVEIWAGNELAQMRLIKKMNPQQPAKYSDKINKECKVEFSPLKTKYLKVVVVPLEILPPWHPNKGKRGWIFVDEIFLN